MRFGRRAVLPRPWSPAGPLAGRVGRVGSLGVAALAVALVLAGLVTPQLRAQAEAEREQAQAAARAERQARIAAADRLRRAGAPGSSLDTRALPGPQERDARVARLLALAAKDGLLVGGLRQTASDAAGAGPGATVQWHAVSLPLRGSYAEIRSFLATALATDAALALDAVQLQREPGGAPDTLRAETTWSLAQRRPDGAAAEGRP